MGGHDDHDERWRSGHPGIGPALETLTSAGTPLLAGFCVTMIGVIAQAPQAFRMPGLTILLLTIAACAFVVSIHCYYWARVHLIESDGTLVRGLPLPDAQHAVRERFAYLAWARRLHVFFQVGILSLFVGLGSAVVPVDGSYRWAKWAAVAVCAVMVAFVLFWTFGFRFLDLVTRAQEGDRMAGLVLRWFRPGEKEYRRYLRHQQHAGGGPLAVPAEAASPRDGYEGHVRQAPEHPDGTERAPRSAG